MKNYYEILEITENASYEIIETSYKILSKKYNPNSWPSQQSFWAEDRLKEVTEAYQILSNPELRKDYDIKLGINNEIDKNEVNNMKKNNNSNEEQNKESYFKRYSTTIKSLIKEQSNESPEERSRDFKALILTIIIISILIFVFWKVPFLHNLIFP